MTARRDNSTALGMPELPEVNRISAAASSSGSSAVAPATGGAPKKLTSSLISLVGTDTESGSSTSVMAWRGVSSRTGRGHCAEERGERDSSLAMNQERAL